MHIQEKVPVDTARKTRKGTVRERKPGYRLVAAMTPAVPIPNPIRPPKMPPLTVALVSTLAFERRVPMACYCEAGVVACSLVMRCLFFFCEDLHGAILEWVRF